MSTYNPRELLTKYLSGNVVESSSNRKGQEQQQVLNACKLLMVQRPKVVYAFILLAKSKLQATLKKFNALLTECNASLSELKNADISSPNLASLKSALDFLTVMQISPGSQVAYDGLKSNLSQFVRSLGKNIKSQNLNVIERTGAEAQADIVDALTKLAEYAIEINYLISCISASVNTWKSLPKLTAQSAVLARALSGAVQIMQAHRIGNISPTVSFVETQALLASLKSIIEVGEIDDDIIPLGKLTSSSFPNGISFFTSEGYWDISGLSLPWELDLAITPSSPLPVVLPIAGASGRAYLLSSYIPNTFTISSNSYLSLVFISSGVETRLRVAISAGTYTPTSISSIINAVIDTGHGVCTLDNSNYLKIVGDSGVDTIVINPSIPNDAWISAHSELGFLANQTSNPIGILTQAELARELQRAIGNSGSVTIVGKKVKIEFPSLFSNTYIAISGNCRSSLGLPERVDQIVDYIVLKKDGIVVDHTKAGEGEGDLIKIFSLPAVVRVEKIYPQYIKISPTIQQYTDSKVKVFSSLQNTAEAVISAVSPIQFDAVSEIEALVTLFNTYAQTLSDQSKNILNAKFSDILSKSSALIDGISPLKVGSHSLISTARTLLAALEDRGMDRAADLLTSVDIATFMDLTADGSSYHGNLLAKSEQVATKDLVQPTYEEDQLESRLNNGIDLNET